LYPDYTGKEDNPWFTAVVSSLGDGLVAVVFIDGDDLQGGINAGEFSV
jgi:hypothetical protein